ncbi:MAG: transporter [Leadbetterella sp.]
MNKKILLVLGLIFVLKGKGFSQMPNDHIYMGKKTACIAVSYSQDSWKSYWENTLKRENFNIGTHTTQTIMPMVAVGVVKNLNAIVSLPYITTKASAGNLMGQSGFQDLSLQLKYRAFNKKGLSLHIGAGASVPTNKYVAEFLPMSIGFGAKTISGRLTANYLHKTGMYVTAGTKYTVRGNTEIDKDAYQAYDGIIYSNQVALPSINEVQARAGWINKGSHIQAEVFYEQVNCLSGDNIRRNDMPFLTNKMEASMIGFYGKFQPKTFGANFRIAQVISGKNVGSTLSITAGLVYQLNHFAKTKKP